MRHHKAKDHNNKVCTTKGLKDRRIRLSPNTAIQLYDVQDRLGFDRSSMAIDWLMKEAKVAIDALISDHQNNLSHDCTNSFDNYSYAVMNSINRCETQDENPIVVPQEINLFSTSTAPMDFKWNTNYNKEEGIGFACREPLQSSFSSSIAHTSSNQFASDNGFLGFPTDQEIRVVQDDEKHNMNVAKHCRHYQY